MNKLDRLKRKNRNQNHIRKNRKGNNRVKDNLRLNSNFIKED